MWRISACFAPGHTQCNTPPTHTHPGWSHMWGLIKRTQTALDRIGDTKQLHLRQLHFTFNYLVMAIDKWRHHKCVSHGLLKVQTDIDDLHGLTRHSGIRFVFALYSLFALLAECTRQIRISLSLFSHMTSHIGIVSCWTWTWNRKLEKDSQHDRVLFTWNCGKQTVRTSLEPLHLRVDETPY